MLGSRTGYAEVRMELAYSGDFNQVTKLPADVVMFSFVQDVLLGLCARRREEQKHVCLYFPCLE